MTLEQLFEEIKQIKQDIKEIKEYIKPKPKQQQQQSSIKYDDEPPIVKETKQEICQLINTQDYFDLFANAIVIGLALELKDRYNSNENTDRNLLKIMRSPSYGDKYQYYLLAFLYLIHVEKEQELGCQLYQSFKKLFIKDKKYIDKDEEIPFEEFYELYKKYCPDLL